MKRKMLLMFSLVLVMIFAITICSADNPVVQTIYTADPFPMVHNGVCYLYTDHDEDVTVNNFYTMNDWKCYTSTDMVNWTDRGTVLSYKSFSWAQGDAWAGQCIYRNGKFYIYVPMTRANAGGARVIGVAVSDSPTGPFTDALGKPLITNNGAQDIDPTVFIDDDGQAYLYWGNGNLYYVKLNQDMISYSGRVVQVSPKPSSYVEGPWLYKRNGLYYMVYAGMGSGSENIAYATSTSPTGPWTSRGVIMPTQGNSFTNHPAVIDYMGNSYFFYHNGALPGGGSYHRSVCLEQFKYNADGSIPTVPWTTTGPPQVGNLNPYVATEAETICWESGVETEKCSEGGIDVCNIENGDYIKVKGVDFGDGATSFETRVASASSGGNIELRLNSPTGTLVGTCAVSGTGGWQTWVTKSSAVSGASGVHDLYLKFTGGSGSLFNFNWWKFNGSGIPTPTPTPVTPTPTLTATPVVTPTPTPTPAGSYVRFRNAATGLFMDGMGSTSNGSNACQWSDSNSTNQQWTIISSGSYVMIQNRATGLYLDGMGRTGNGSVCGQWGGSGSANQQWTQEALGSYVRFKNRATGLYLDGMGSTGNGSNLCQWGNSASANQQWQIR
jgi:arabinoxylan arabinofuranohydrolase